MRAILGQYYYAPHRRSFGVWQWTDVSETGACGTFIKDFRSKEEAREFVWQQNGWGKPLRKLNLDINKLTDIDYGDNGGSKRNDSTSC